MANEDAIYIGELAMPMIKGEKGDKGDQGPQGIQGIQGVAGESSTIDIGLVQTGSPTTPTTVVNSGTPSHAILDFVIQKGDKGDKGDTGEIVSVSATTLSSTSQAYARNNGTTTDAELELGIPKGVGISNVTIDENYDVIVTLDNNTEINAGSLAELEAIRGYVEGSYRTPSLRHPSVVQEWNENTTYYLGNYVVHNNHIYECIYEVSTEGSFIGNEWAETDLLNWSMQNTTFLKELQTAFQDIGIYCELKENKVTSISSSSTDTQYPSAKAVYDATKDSITSTDYITESKPGIVKSGYGLTAVGNGCIKAQINISGSTIWNSNRDFFASLDSVRTGILYHLDTSINSSSLDDHYPSSKAVYNYVASVVGDINSVLDAINR